MSLSHIVVFFMPFIAFQKTLGNVKKYSTKGRKKLPVVPVFNIHFQSSPKLLNIY